MSIPTVRETINGAMDTGASVSIIIRKQVEKNNFEIIKSDKLVKSVNNTYNEVIRPKNPRKI